MAASSKLALASLAVISVALTGSGVIVAERTLLGSASAFEAGGSRMGLHTTTESDSVFGVFEGRTPCGPVATAFTQFPAQNCEKIKWRLTLFRDLSTGSPTTYLYEGTRTERAGTWRIEHHRSGGAPRFVYHLRYGSPPSTLSLLEADENVLLIMDRELRVLVGDASWSYVLNRKGAAGSSPGE